MAGKKVFFVRPHSVVQRQMVSELIENEYEVILVRDAEEARGVFVRHPDCLAFLNIDEGLSEEGWEAFILSIQSDPALVRVKLGILTYNPDPELARKYLMEHAIPCGFIRLSLHLADSTATVMKVLEANEARGQRRYLRVMCDETAQVNLKVGSTVFDGRVIELSSVGMTCTLDPDHRWVKHTAFRSLQLRLKGNLCLVSGVVMGSRILNGTTSYVILFDSKTSPEQKGRIRAYMRWCLQNWAGDPG